MARTRKSESLAHTFFSDLSARIERKPTVPEQVADALRESILRGELKPGDPVVESQIARQLRVGQPTVREALKTLEGEGLVVRLPNRGCFVMKLSEADVEQIFRLRAEWETLAVELALEDWKPEKAAPLKQALAAMETAAKADDVQGYYRADLEFHRTIWRLSGNPYLERALLQITLPAFAFAVILLQENKDFSLRANAKEHAAIADAIMGGHKEAAMKTMRDSLSHFRDNTHGIMA